MFSNLAHFFIKNSKLTFVLVLVTLISGIWSYLIIPKQYNPTIVVPAFSIMVKAPSLNSDEVKKFITDELENKIMELEWIDETYWVSNENYAWVMVKFKVWQDKEKAKIRLTQKLEENMDLKPLWVENPIIKSIDPDELPQITYAVSYNKDLPQSRSSSKEGSSKVLPLNKGELEGVLSTQDQSIYLRQIANIIKNELKKLPNVTTLEIVWWNKKNIVVELDLAKLEAKNADIMQVYDILQKNNLSLPAWDLNLNSWEKIALETNGNIDNIENLKKLVIYKSWDSILYLWDIADIRYWEKRLSYATKYSDKNTIWENAVLLWVWKQIWTNWVFVTEAVKEKVSELQKTLPKNIKISVIQDEWEQAREATSDLIKDLIESILIVIVILVIFLWFKNALNTATSIPLILSLVFLYAYIVWYNINRISLFALILVIWMLVDDSIVVVENIHRHLEERVHTWETKLQAILKAVQEVWPGVILSTITKVLSFAWMFAVTWMMWEYMWPIPKFAIVALLLSILIAFTINPWVSFLTAKEVTEWDKNHEKKKKSRFDIRILYVKIMEYFISDKPNTKKRRKIFKLVFWVSLVLVIILPIYTWIFKARMLPKSNQNQVYLWIDAPRGTNIDKMLEVEKSVEEFFLTPSNSPLSGGEPNNSSPDKGRLEGVTQDLNIVQSISSTIWTPFMWDFANMFRWGSTRWNEYQISSRINLVPKETDKNRLKSEEFVIKIRPLLRKYLLSIYPDLTIRLLEDPPGPPVRATFMMKLKTESDTTDLNNFTNKVYSEVKKISSKYDLADLWTSLSTTYKKIEIKLDSESVSRAWLTAEQVAYILAIAKNSMPISLVKDSESLEPTNIILWVKNDEIETTKLLNNITFTNNEGQKIHLSSIANINYTFVTPEINTDGRQETNFIYSEMWDNSVVYPVVKLYSILQSESFLGNDYKFLWWDFYGLHYEWIKDWKKYDIEWDWEWKLTMDTFRDLWTAMIIAIIAIYFLIVGQFRSFSVAWIIMLPFLLWLFGIFPGFSILYLFKNEYFNATSMIWIISLAWIVVWNAILLIDYVMILKERWWTIEKSIIEAGYIRFMPIMLTSISAIFWAVKITSDPVWSWLARSIVWWLSSSAILTLIAIPIFYYDSQKKNWE